MYIERGSVWCGQGSISFLGVRIEYMSLRFCVLDLSLCVRNTCDLWFSDADIPEDRVIYLILAYARLTKPNAQRHTPDPVAPLFFFSFAVWVPCFPLRDFHFLRVSSQLCRLRLTQVVGENAGDTYVRMKLKDQQQSMQFLQDDPSLSQLKKVWLCVCTCMYMLYVLSRLCVLRYVCVCTCMFVFCVLTRLCAYMFLHACVPQHALHLSRYCLYISLPPQRSLTIA
jgi:hypothetical protein